jgi:hypothetical protein
VEKVGGHLFTEDICEYRLYYGGSSGAPVFNKKRELLGVMTDKGVATVPGILKNVDEKMERTNENSKKILSELMSAEKPEPEIVTFHPNAKNAVQAEQPVIAEEIHEEAIELQLPSHPVQASSPPEVQSLPPPPTNYPPPALFGYLLDLPGRRIAEITNQGKLGSFTNHDHRFNEGISCVLIPEGLLITGPDPNGMQNAAIFTKTEMLEITSTIWPRQYHTSVYFQHKALVISGAHTPKVEQLMSQDHSWENAGSLPEKRAYSASTVHRDFIYLLGGVVGNGIDPSNSIIRGDGVTWSRIDLQLPYAAKGAGCAQLDDKVLIYGGKDNDGVWEGDFTAGTFAHITNFKMDGNMNGLQPAVFDRQAVVIPSDAGTVYLYLHAGRNFKPAYNLASAA